MTFLQLESVRKQFGSVVALAGIDLAVDAGTRTAIVGPSGSGKTTLLRVIAGFTMPDTGRVIIDGQVMADDSGATPAHLRGIGVVAQDGALFPHLSVADNVGFGLDRSLPDRSARIEALMSMVGLDLTMLTRRPDQLSGGQQQRVALARALARKPRLMLLDEPFAALDTGLRASTRKAVADLLGAAGITTILVTHDQAEALSFADQVAVMRAGRLIQVGTPHDLYLRPKDQMVAEFLGEAIVLPAQAADGLAACALGLVDIRDKSRRGPVWIMLRPEQVSLTQATDEERTRGATAGTVFGKVLEVDFAGAVCTVSVRLLDAANGNADDGSRALPLTLRKSYIEAPPPGAIVRIAIAGEAHVFPEDFTP